MLLAGCSSSPSAPHEDSATTARPSSPLTVVADADPAAAAVRVSRALFARSDVAVVARDGDRAGTLLGAATAVGLGVPLLVDGSGAADELRRLGVRRVLAVGARPDLGVRSVTVPADPKAVTSATGLRFGGDGPVDDADALRAVVALDPRRPAALRPADAPAAPAGGRPERLPAVRRPAALNDVVVLASGSPESLAGVATPGPRARGWW